MEIQTKALPVPLPPLHAMPAFVGGFMFGMTGENHLEEVELCYHDDAIMYNEVMFSVDKITKGGWNNIT